MTKKIRNNFIISISLVLADAILWFFMDRTQRPYSLVVFYYYNNIFLAFYAPFAGLIGLTIAGTRKKGWGSIFFITAMILNIWIPIDSLILQFFHHDEDYSRLPLLLRFPFYIIFIGFAQAFVFIRFNHVNEKKRIALNTISEPIVEFSRKKFIINLLVSIFIIFLLPLLLIFCYDKFGARFYAFYLIQFISIVFYFCPVWGILAGIYSIITQKGWYGIIFLSSMITNIVLAARFISGMFESHISLLNSKFAIYNTDILLTGFITLAALGQMVVFIMMILSLQRKEGENI